MNKTLIVISIIVIIFLLIFFARSCENNEKETTQTSLPEFRKGELVVVYKNAPTPEAKQKIRDKIVAEVEISGLTIRECGNCDSYVELWTADSIETFLHGEWATSGTGKTKPVGEDELAVYSLNLVSGLPVDFTPVSEKYISDQSNRRTLITPDINATGKDTIVVAVIDTGIDTLRFNNRQYLWTNKTATSCDTGFSFGWNFVKNNSNVFDDNDTKHGTIVSHFIINEFKNAPDNFVQIMSLKTHDDKGNGDLFSAICAIHYAMEKGANIINASWGFYNHDHITHPYLDSLITTGLQEKGILFIAAAGNRVASSDSLLRIYYKNTTGNDLPDDSLRNLNINKFYPAVLSRQNDNNVVTITTVYNENSSLTQNFSHNYVDIGVQADTTTSTHLAFKMPFPANQDYLSGSSFATAIASGKIGAYLPKSVYNSGIRKKEVIQTLSNIHTTYGIPPIVAERAVLHNKRLIRSGTYSYASK